MANSSRLLWWLGALGAAAALFAYSRTQSGAAVAADVVDAVLSPIRGIRNNNPGNIRVVAGVTWQGQIGVDDDGFLIFDTMENGIRAIARILKNYQRLYGLNTVRAIATRWSATDQTAYTANLSSWLGVDEDESIDVSDPETLGVLVRGIIRQENGLTASLLVSNSDIDQGVALA